MGFDDTGRGLTSGVGRRAFLRTASAITLAPALAGTQALFGLNEAAEKVPQSRQCRWGNYKRVLIVDGLGTPGNYASGDDDVPLSQTMLEDIRASGITAVNLTLNAIGNVQDIFERAFRSIGFWERELDAHPDVLLKVRKAEDLDEAKGSSRLGIIYGFQDGTPLGSDVSRLDLFYRFGLRILQPTYNQRNLLGDGCLEPANGGLSRLGHEVIKKANSLGILLDLSHCGSRTTDEGIAASASPVAVTHSGCASIAKLPRNKTDGQMRAVAEKGGVVGIYLMPFLRDAGQPHLEDLIRHVEHAVKVCGEDHVGIGTDGPISGIELTSEFIAYHREFVLKRRAQGIAAPGEHEDVFNFIPELNSPDRFRLMGEQFLCHGFSMRATEKILGGNFTRLFRDVWQGGDESK